MGGVSRAGWVRLALPVATGGSAAVWALWAVWTVGGHDPGWASLVTQPIGLILIGIGVYVWARSTVDCFRMGLLLIAAGSFWYLGDLQLIDDPALARLGSWLFPLHAVFLAHVLLTYPEGRLSQPVHRVAIGTLYLSTLVIQGGRALAEEPLPPQLWGDPGAQTSVWSSVGGVIGGLLTALVVVLIGQRWHAETPPGVAPAPRSGSHPR